MMAITVALGDIDANFYNGCGEKNVKPPLFKLSDCFQDGLLFHVPGDSSNPHHLGLLGIKGGQGVRNCCNGDDILESE